MTTLAFCHTRACNPSNRAIAFLPSSFHGVQDSPVNEPLRFLSDLLCTDPLLGANDSAQYNGSIAYRSLLAGTDETIKVEVSVSPSPLSVIFSPSTSELKGFLVAIQRLVPFSTKFKQMPEWARDSRNGGRRFRSTKVFRRRDGVGLRPASLAPEALLIFKPPIPSTVPY